MHSFRHPVHAIIFNVHLEGGIKLTNNLGIPIVVEAKEIE
jgi:hypothetical protein